MTWPGAYDGVNMFTLWWPEIRKSREEGGGDKICPSKDTDDLGLVQRFPSMLLSSLRTPVYLLILLHSLLGSALKPQTD